MLHDKFPSLVTEGFLALAAAPPVLYITSRTYTEVAQYVCSHLNLPASTIRYVCSGDEDGSGLDTFAAAIDEDAAAGRTPLMCVANVHSTIFQKQSVSKLQV